MLFKNRHVPLIRDREKTVTRRVWKENYNRPVEGSVHMVQAACLMPDDADYDSPMMLSAEECDCFIQIEAVYDEPLGEMTDEDAQDEGNYETVEEFRETWEQINGEWDPEQVVAVVEFTYVGTGPFYTRLGNSGIDVFHGKDNCHRLKGAETTDRSPTNFNRDWNPCQYCILPGDPNVGSYDFSYQTSLYEAGKQNAG